FISIGTFRSRPGFVDVIACSMANLRTGFLDFHIYLPPGVLIGKGRGIVAERILLMQFLQQNLRNSSQRIIPASKHPEGTATTYAGQAIEHVMIDVVSGSSQNQWIVVIVVNPDRIYQDFRPL